VQNNIQYDQEETINLRELLLVLKKRKVLISIVTSLFTLLALGYVFTAKPVYEVKAVVELAQINKQPVHPTETLKQKIDTIFEVAIKDKKVAFPVVSSVKIPKNTENILVLQAQGYDNDSAKVKLQEVISYLSKMQVKELENYTKEQKQRLSLVESDIAQNKKFIEKIRNEIGHYEQKLLNISKQDAALAGIYAIQLGKKQTELNSIINKISYLKNNKNDIKFTLDPQKLQKTALIGNVDVRENPIKPKKKLIVIVAFITGLTLSIFLVFFLAFMTGIKKED
jgi:uncharacterized protein involved in exopolysaccharide biosynthesis